MILDEEKQLKKLDTDNMLQAISDFPAQIESCWKQMKSFSIPTHYIQAKNIIILGMGGSAIGGALVSSFVLKKSRVPIFVHRDYDLPVFVGSDTLVIGVSYSGNTEETISGFEKAGQLTNKLIGISTGGQLGSLCRKFRAPFFEINYGSQPRAALGYLLTAVLGIATKLGFIEVEDHEINEAIVLLKAMEGKIHPGVRAAQNQAKQLADRLRDKTPIIIGSGELSEVARRWKTQFNENSKQVAHFEILPEVNHNAIVGLDFPKKLSEKIFVILLQSKFSHPRVKIREQVTLQLFQQRKIQYETIYLQSATTPLNEMLLAIFLGDYVSYYLAMLNAVNPTTIEPINYLKDRLAASK